MTNNEKICLTDGSPVTPDTGRSTHQPECRRAMLSSARKNVLKVLCARCVAATSMQHAGW